MENLPKPKLAEILNLTSDFSACDNESVERHPAGFNYEFCGERDMPIDSNLKAYVLGLIDNPLLKDGELELSLDFGSWSDFNKMEVSYRFAREHFDTMVDFVSASGYRFSVELKAEEHPDEAVAGEAAAEGLAVLEEVAVVMLGDKPASQAQIDWLNTSLWDLEHKPEGQCLASKHVEYLRNHGCQFVGDIFSERPRLGRSGDRMLNRTLHKLRLKAPQHGLPVLTGWKRPVA